MSYVLRDYQQKASDAAVSFFNNKAKKTNAIMVLPTGSGKSLIIADIAARLDGHTLVFQPSKEILEQNFKKLCSYGILDCSIYSASFNSKEISRITFATIGSIDPTGFASPLRAISTPVIKVEVTAPNPTQRTPNLPVAGFTFIFSILISLLKLHLIAEIKIICAKVTPSFENFHAFSSFFCSFATV